jgi:hypothetical protein
MADATGMNNRGIDTLIKEKDGKNSSITGHMNLSVPPEQLIQCFDTPGVKAIVLLVATLEAMPCCIVILMPCVSPMRRTCLAIGTRL